MIVRHLKLLPQVEPILPDCNAGLKQPHFSSYLIASYLAADKIVIDKAKLRENVQAPSSFCDSYS